MGSEISKKYHVAEQPCASGGNACLWRIYSARSRATGEKVSLWVFNKSEDMKELSDKTHRERIMDILRRELKTLSIMKHPSIVNVIETFEEARGNGLAFVSERVKCSLANTMGHLRYVPLNSKAANAAQEMGAIEMYEVTRGLSSLIEALKYVHTISRRLHLNICPESILISPTGLWKLAGFGYSMELPKDGGESLPCPHFHGVNGNIQYFGKWRLAPSLLYASPEATGPLSEGSVSSISDGFSLGCLGFEAYSRCMGHRNIKELLGFKDFLNPKDCIESIKNGAVQKALQTVSLPEPARQLIISLTALSPMARINVDRILSYPIFQQVEVVALRTMDMLGNRDPAEAATFLKSFRNSISDFPLRVQKEVILISLLSTGSLSYEGKLWSFILPIVGDICAIMSTTESSVLQLQDRILPALSMEEPSALQALVDLIPIFLKHCSTDYFSANVIPMMCRSLTKDGYSDLQGAALASISQEIFLTAVKSDILESELLPRICWVSIKSDQLSSRVNALMCISKIFIKLQEEAVIFKVMPTLKFAIEKDKSVAVQLCCLGCYDAIAKWIPDKAYHISQNILPAVTPILIHHHLNTKQFEMVAAKIQELLNEAITEQRSIVLTDPNGRVPKTQISPSSTQNQSNGGKSGQNKEGSYKGSIDGYAARIALGVTSSVTSMFVKSNKPKQTSSIGDLEKKPAYIPPADNSIKSSANTCPVPSDFLKPSQPPVSTIHHGPNEIPRKSAATDTSLMLHAMPRPVTADLGAANSASEQRRDSTDPFDAFNTILAGGSQGSNSSNRTTSKAKEFIQEESYDFSPLKPVIMPLSSYDKNVNTFQRAENSVQSLEHQVHSTQKEIDALMTQLNVRTPIVNPSSRQISFGFDLSSNGMQQPYHMKTDISNLPHSNIINSNPPSQFSFMQNAPTSSMGMSSYHQYEPNVSWGSNSSSLNGSNVATVSTLNAMPPQQISLNKRIDPFEGLDIGPS